VAILRVGPQPDSTPAREQLGRVLVTIDDLQALMDIIRSEANDPHTVQVQFSGGFFTEAEDIRRLSDAEKSTLKVISDVVEVNLSENAADAVGDPKATFAVRYTWARSRQTRIRTRRDSRFPIAAGLIVGLIVLGLMSNELFSGALLFSNHDLTAFPLALKIAMILVVIIFLMAQLALLDRRRITATPAAIIEPMTMQEWRQLKNINRYPRASWIVAIIAALVAVAAIIVPVLTAK
jgi:hypothetical protein